MTKTIPIQKAVSLAVLVLLFTSTCQAKRHRRKMGRAKLEALRGGKRKLNVEWGGGFDVSGPTGKSPTMSPTPKPVYSDDFFWGGGEEVVAARTSEPSQKPTPRPTTRLYLTMNPTGKPTPNPTKSPSAKPTNKPTNKPTLSPSNSPSWSPSWRPSFKPTNLPTPRPTPKPTNQPTNRPTNPPTPLPTPNPTNQPTNRPTNKPTSSRPTNSPSKKPVNTLFIPSGTGDNEWGSSSGGEIRVPPPTKSPTKPPYSGWGGGVEEVAPLPTSYSPTDRPTTKRPTGKPTGKPTAKPSPSPVDVTSGWGSGYNDGVESVTVDVSSGGDEDFKDTFTITEQTENQESGRDDTSISVGDPSSAASDEADSFFGRDESNMTHDIFHESNSTIFENIFDYDEPAHDNFTSTNATDAQETTGLDKHLSVLARACDAFENNEVYTTDNSLEINFEYEVAIDQGFGIDEIAQSIDEQLENHVGNEVLDCDERVRERFLLESGEILGIENSPDAVTNEECTYFTDETLPPDTECYVLQGKTILYLNSTTGGTVTEEVHAILEVSMNKQADEYLNSIEGLRGVHYQGQPYVIPVSIRSTNSDDSQSETLSPIWIAGITAISAGFIAIIAAMFICRQRRAVLKEPETFHKFEDDQSADSTRDSTAETRDFFVDINIRSEEDAFGNTLGNEAKLGSVGGIPSYMKNADGF